MSRLATTSWTLLALTLTLATAAPGDDRPGTGCTQPIPDLYERLSPAVVSIAAASINPADRTEQVTRVEGSGFIIDSAGLILTNSHVVFGRQAIFVTLDDGTTLPGALVGADPILDLAVLRIQPPSGVTLPALRFGDSGRLRVGEEVLAIGNPLGLEQTLTHGLVSSIDRLMPEVPFSLTEPLIQIDAPINPGNSGGPVIDRCGEVVGIASSILAGAQGISFAIPSNLAAQVIPPLERDGRIIRPWLGVQGTMVTEDLQDLLRAPLEPGLLVEVVETNSPAQKAGVQGGQLDLVIGGRPVLIGGDVITVLNGRTIDTAEAFAAAVSGLAVGDTLELTLAHDGDRRDLRVQLSERPLLPEDLATDAAFAASARDPAPVRAPAPRLGL